MEPQQQNHHQQQQNQLPTDDVGSGKNSFMCRQSSTRWTPTTEQIRILKDLYYNNGVRSPSADQIQKISAKLRQYGKIEGKNVFYWFQNHKARERQKKRLTTDIPMQRSGLWRPEESFYNAKYPNITTGNFSTSIPPVLLLPFHFLISVVMHILCVLLNSCIFHFQFPLNNFEFLECSFSGAPSSSTSMPGLNAAASQVGNYAYGSLAMEKSFRVSLRNDLIYYGEIRTINTQARCSQLIQACYCTKMQTFEVTESKNPF